MTRAISTSLRRELEKAGTEEVVFVTLTLTHATLAEAIRLVCHPVSIIVGGETYNASWFDLALPSDSDAYPQTTVTIPNVDAEIGLAIRALRGDPMRAEIAVYSGADFDLTTDPIAPLATPVVEYRARHLFLVNLKVDPLEITGDIIAWNYTQQTWPGRRATKNRLPGLFRAQ